ncbi:hypothetical protein BDV38DRAFT_262239 [Aspergillus pseudotamarii]|uniref:Uncharacterized protein n=1 Tax=Aspergillus pseudotamarii TaxID=132259 RepID=A0A5N6SEF1_ASPPS|nr:uncharacterized protein BDV38DRAFT_262239 [Aspergillus pseudotamarii]KAE8132061.1 hypothetical protein BDV38DRAFT_262239 [Aspergillus pseudotamarii]
MVTDKECSQRLIDTNLLESWCWISDCLASIYPGFNYEVRFITLPTFSTYIGVQEKRPLSPQHSDLAVARTTLSKWILPRLSIRYLV